MLPVHRPMALPPSLPPRPAAQTKDSTDSSAAPTSSADPAQPPPPPSSPLLAGALGRWASHTTARFRAHNAGPCPLPTDFRKSEAARRTLALPTGHLLPRGPAIALHVPVRAAESMAAGSLPAERTQHGSNTMRALLHFHAPPAGPAGQGSHPGRLLQIPAPATDPATAPTIASAAMTRLPSPPSMTSLISGSVAGGPIPLAGRPSNAEDRDSIDAAFRFPVARDSDGLPARESGRQVPEHDGST